MLSLASMYIFNEQISWYHDNKRENLLLRYLLIIFTKSNWSSATREGRIIFFSWKFASWTINSLVHYCKSVKKFSNQFKHYKERGIYIYFVFTARCIHMYFDLRWNYICTFVLIDDSISVYQTQRLDKSITTTDSTRSL